MGSQDNFERAPPPNLGGGDSQFAFPPGHTAEPQRSTPSFVYPPGRSDDDKEDDLAGDEEFAAQLAAQLRLTDVHEPPPSDDHRLPRVGDMSSSMGLPSGANTLGDHGTVDDTHQGVEYHAMDSDGEDAFAEAPRSMAFAPMICNVLLDLLRQGAPVLSRNQKSYDEP